MKFLKKGLAIGGLAALLLGCEGRIPQKLPELPQPKKAAATPTAKKSPPSSVKKSSPKPIKHLMTLKIFDQKYTASMKGSLNLLKKLNTKLKEVQTIDRELSNYLKKQDLKKFKAEYQKGLDILANLDHVDSLYFRRFFATAIRSEKGKEPKPDEVFQPFEMGADYLKLINRVKEQTASHSAFHEVFQALERNPFPAANYQGLEDCCNDPDARTYIGLIKRFGQNFHHKNKGNGTNTDTYWSLKLVFDDQQLVKMKKGKKELFPEGEFVDITYHPRADIMTICYIQRSKKNPNYGHTSLTEKKFRVLDLGGDGILTGLDAQINAIKPDTLEAVNKDYKLLLKRIVGKLKTRYQGKFFD